MAYPSPSSLEDLCAGWLLVRLLPQVFVSDLVRPVDLQYASQTPIDERLDLVVDGVGGSSCFSSIEKDRFDVTVEDADFGSSGDDLECQMFLSCRKAALAFPILHLTSASVPP